MNRKLKALGLALFAVFALSAVGAGAAQAEFNSHEKDIVLTDIEEGTSAPHEFSVNGSSAVVCNLDVEGRNTGTGSGPTWSTSTVTVGVDYTECEFEGEPATVDDDMCHYELGSTTDANGHADVTLKGCSENGGITITINELVTIHVPHQTIKGAVHYTNTGETENGSTVDVVATTDDIEYSCTLAFLCELGGIIPAEGNEGSYTGAIEVGGFKYISGDTTTYVDGAQTSISVDGATEG